MEEYEVYTLPNGIRIAHKQISHTQIAHCGIMLDIGSRDEQPEQQGLAHFWEHMAFKGTEKRKSYHIINRLETVGGELNAYTTKEKVCFHASLLGIHFEKATELLADIAFHSIFPEKQIENERSVILEEMAMYYDSPEDAIQDDFDDIVFQNHPLGGNILGTSETVNSFTRAFLQQFIADNLDTERIVFSSVSNWPFSKVLRVAEKYLRDVPHRTAPRRRQAPKEYTPKRMKVERPITQAQYAMGKPAYALPDPKRLPFFMLVNLLGGPGMNSRLNLAVREKYGLVYTIDSTYSPYTDTGLFGIYFGTEGKQVKRTLGLVQKELKLLREKSLTTNQLHVAKHQLMGQLAMSEESNGGMMQLLGKSTLDLGRVEPLSEIFGKIEQISAAELQEMANEVLTEEHLSVLQYVPEGK